MRSWVDGTAWSAEGRSRKKVPPAPRPLQPTNRQRPVASLRAVPSRGTIGTPTRARGHAPSNTPAHPWTGPARSALLSALTPLHPLLELRDVRVELRTLLRREDVADVGPFTLLQRHILLTKLSVGSRVLLLPRLAILLTELLQLRGVLLMNVLQALLL